MFQPPLKRDLKDYRSIFQEHKLLYPCNYKKIELPLPAKKKITEIVKINVL